MICWWLACGLSCAASVNVPQRAERIAMTHAGRPRIEVLADAAALPAGGSCEVSRPAEALATPDPLLDPTNAGDRVAVSFIIGADGQVHSPVILESAGSDEDRNVLNALRSWRYRPAMCNAAPFESESRVEFSSH
jgi:TonB family protein